MMAKLQIQLLREKADVTEIRYPTADESVTEMDAKQPVIQKVNVL